MRCGCPTAVDSTSGTAAWGAFTFGCNPDQQHPPWSPSSRSSAAHAGSGCRCHACKRRAAQPTPAVEHVRGERVGTMPQRQGSGRSRGVGCCRALLLKDRLRQRCSCRKGKEPLSLRKKAAKQCLTLTTAATAAARAPTFFSSSASSGASYQGCWACMLLGRPQRHKRALALRQARLS